MARLSLDDSNSSSSSSSAKTKASKSKKGGGLGLGNLDSGQKVKAGIAIGVILLAGVFILYSLGLFDGLFRSQASSNSGATPEEVQAYEEAVRQQEQMMRRSGTPPRPVGAN